MKLALGTVQFGLDYGISNKQGQVDKDQVADILKLALSLGIDTLDCAGAYGNSEQVLGELFKGYLFKDKCLKRSFNIVSKIPALTHEQRSINEFFSKTLSHLHQERIDTLLFHHADNLLNHPKKHHLFEQLQRLKAQGKVNRIGVSVYSPKQLKEIVSTYPIDLVQAPLNVFDQRFISTDILKTCQKHNVKLHVRSLFLQGLLFIEQGELPYYFSPYKEKLNAFTELAHYLNCSKLTLALAIVAQELPYFKLENKVETKIDNNAETDIIEKVVVGVCSTKQLSAIVNAYQQAKELPLSRQELLNLADNRIGLINPSIWSAEKT